MERFLERSFRIGAIPICCTMATCCFAVYSAKISHASKEWAALALSLSLGSIDERTKHTQQQPSIVNPSQSLEYSNLLNQHAGTCAALAIVSSVITFEAHKDWHGYRSLRSIDHMETWLRKRPLPFFARVSVLTSTVLSLLVVKKVYNGVRLVQPPHPPPLPQSLKQHD